MPVHALGRLESFSYSRGHANTICKRCVSKQIFYIRKTDFFYLNKHKPARFLVFIYFSVLITSSYKFNECLYPTLHSFRIQRPALRRPRSSAPQYQQTLPVLTLVAPGFHLASTHDAGKLLPT